VLSHIVTEKPQTNTGASVTQHTVPYLTNLVGLEIFTSAHEMRTYDEIR